MIGQRDESENGDAVAELVRRDIGVIAADETGFLKRADATQTGRRRNADMLGQINTQVGSLAASNTTSGAIVISQTGGALAIAAGGVRNLAAAGGTIILTVSGGTLTVNGVVAATGTGRVLLGVTGAGNSITTTAAISSGSGAISLLAANAVTLGGGVSTGGSGTLDIEAAAGNLTVNDGNAVQTAGGNIYLFAQGSAAITGISAGAGAVSW